MGHPGNEGEQQSWREKERGRRDGETGKNAVESRGEESNGASFYGLGAPVTAAAARPCAWRPMFASSILLCPITGAPCRKVPDA
eukprot:CAMPEP_0174378504 /NCGR_PEP_ID=MMETSP0811_2-20130205/122096_1 /TAXON_ID=73025 ORGANISM="Eutreptiella gymnastica-like, Strain CCMP1594" /NCGR_SAMPLE_ID=MMETSP0811_2 /ASSEMBLY_ACC=CAM_ASM_000667 /LENGTH=83 /DNA_ID=CAMNT_0015530743 /DNA_START=286 /DNA_END=537 /DNA_ORIENTATION=+